MTRGDGAVRRLALLGAIGVLGIMLAGVGAASAAASPKTIYACVKKHSGATRIVSRKARCARGESKLSWAGAGPAGSPGPRGLPGANGTNGVNGVNGANGAITLYSAAKSEGVEVPPANVGEPASPPPPLVSKVIPPGSYYLSAKVLFAAEAATAGFIEVLCALSSSPGTAVASTGNTIDVSVLNTPLFERGASEFSVTSELVFQGALSTPVTSTVALYCGLLNGGKGLTVRAGLAQLGALETTSNS
jgi:hypothetical protein